MEAFPQDKHHQLRSFIHPLHIEVGEVLDLSTTR